MYGLINYGEVKRITKAWDNFYAKYGSKMSLESLTVLFALSIESEKEFKTLLYATRKRKLNDIDSFNMEDYISYLIDNEGSFKYNESEFIKIVKLIYTIDTSCSLSYIADLIYLSSCDSYWSIDKCSLEEIKVESRYNLIKEHLLDEDKVILKDILEGKKNNEVYFN